jgi:phospholipase/carboxylesterase
MTAGDARGPAIVATTGNADPAAPLVVLLHGCGSHGKEILALADHLPVGPAYVSVRAPIAENGGYAWFATAGLDGPSRRRCAPQRTGSAAGSTTSRRRDVRWS